MVPSPGPDRAGCPSATSERVRVPLLPGTVVGAVATCLSAAAVTVAQLRRAAHIGRLDSPDPAPFTTGAAAPEAVVAWFGDSIAAGTGIASLVDALPGVVARHLADAGIATMTCTHAVDGARAGDLPGQVATADLSHVDVAVVHIGANDTSHRTPLEAVASSLHDAFEALTAQVPTVIAIDLPPMWAAPLVPGLLRPWIALRARRVSATLRAAAHDTGVAVVAMGWQPPAWWRRHAPLAEFAADRYHPAAPVVAPAAVPVATHLAALLAGRRQPVPVTAGTAAPGPISG